MTVEELIEALREMPPTATVIFCYNNLDGDPIDDDFDSVIYEFGQAVIRLKDEQEATS